MNESGTQGTETYSELSVGMFGERRYVRRAEACFAVHDLDAQLALQLCVPNAIYSLSSTASIGWDVVKEESRPIESVADTPSVFHLEVFASKISKNKTQKTFTAEAAQVATATSAADCYFACANQINVHLCLGWDGFSTSKFGKRHRSANGFYCHVINTPHRLRPMTLAVTNKEVPTHCVLSEIWDQCERLTHRQPGLMIMESDDGEIEVRSVKWTAQVDACALDKQMLDPFQLSPQSNIRNRCDGALYRGYEEGLECEDLCSLDCRFLRNWEYTVRMRREILNGISTKSRFDNVCTEEGWTRAQSAEEWHPSGSQVLNPFLHGICDPLHTWDGILDRMMRWITSECLKEDPGVWNEMESCLRKSYDFNGLSMPADPFGRQMSERTNMKLRIEHAWHLWLSLHAVRPGEARVGCLRWALELIGFTYSCESDEQVSIVQTLTKRLLRAIQKLSSQDGTQMNFPKMRALINFAFVVLPLHRNRLLWQTADIENDHVLTKSVSRALELER